MDQCFWCHKDKELYAYNLCLSCYRWFKRKINSPTDYCDLCGAVVAKNQKGICKKCKILLEQTTDVSKRVQNIKDKFGEIREILDKYTDPSEAYVFLDELFKLREKKFLDVLLDRYYRYMTLEEIGKRYNNTREYIRQCEDKAIEIIKRKSMLFHTGIEDDDKDDLFSSKW